MTWEETIKYIRCQPEFKYLIEVAYLEEDLKLNAERFIKSEEFEETLQVLHKFTPGVKSILDVGSGNGISVIAFALNGYNVTVAEPNPSETVGTGAIRSLLKTYNIENVKVYEEFAENITTEKLFDIIYVRQAMHHAYNLTQFIKNLSNLLKPGGFLLTVRDHVIYNEPDKKWFLESHPLQKFYGGENAYTSKEYQAAMVNANLTIIKEWRHFDNVINYFPLTRSDVLMTPSQREKEIENKLAQKLGAFGRTSIAKFLYKKTLGRRSKKVFDETRIPGRMYSYLAQKN